MTVLVRPATPDDVPDAADVLADAFADYPWTRWTVDADDHGERLRPLHHLYLSAVALPFGRGSRAPTGTGCLCTWRRAPRPTCASTSASASRWPTSSTSPVVARGPG
jgi:hypothetical protein